MSRTSWIASYIAAALVAGASAGASSATLADEQQRPSPGRAAASGIEARSKVSPTVESAMDTRPSDIRPDNRPIPQISIPLRRNARQATTAPAGAAPVDDGVARCLAMKSRAERRECLVRRPE